MSADEEEKAKWKFIRVLGKGGFGCVSLYQNEVSERKIAVKKCRLMDNISDKMWERWETEVYIMSKLDHENVIRAVEVPAQLAPGPNEPPVLAMEFCEGGDLRKVLNRPENCCGLKENEIRQLVQGIGSAIEYLHSNRIIHRDLKPENIVLKSVSENRTLYKIIDLGYAKEMDFNSICNSFVGTVQYLAPELYVTKPYTTTVDHWSFGYLVFECIAGFRPFLPSTPPVEWHKEVCQKSPDDICAQFDENKQIKFSKKLPSPNQLCKPLQGYLEQWLRLMLRWDPKARGGGVIEIQGVMRPKCFYLLEQIFALKILHILYVETNTVLSYPVNETHTIADVRGAIEHETGIPKESQDIILANGFRLEPADLAIQGYCESNVDDMVVFLFRRGAIRREQYIKKDVPANVQAIMREPQTLLQQKDHRKAWALAVYWCSEQCRDYQHLILSQRAALLNLLRSNAHITKQVTQMNTDVGKLMACKEHFKLSLDFDIEQSQNIMKSVGHGLNGLNPKILHNWNQMGQHIDNCNSLYDRVQNIDKSVTSLSTAITELDNSSFCRHKQQKNELEPFVKQAKDLYDDLQKASSGNQHDMMDHSRIAEVVANCFVKRDEATEALLIHLNKVIEYQFQLESLLNELTVACGDIEAARRQLISMQQKRQSDIWKLIGVKVSNVGESKQENSLATRSFTSPSMSSEMTTLDISLGSSFQSMKLMDDSKLNSLRLTEVIQSIVSDEEQSSQSFSLRDGS